MWSIHIIGLFHLYSYIWQAQECSILFQAVLKLLAQSSANTTWKEKLHFMRLLNGWIKQTFIYCSCPMNLLKMASQSQWLLQNDVYPSSCSGLGASIWSVLNAPCYLTLHCIQLQLLILHKSLFFALGKTRI